MKRIIVFLLLLAVLSLSCGYRGYLRLFRAKVPIAEVIAIKGKIDTTDNPARRHVILSQLKEKLVDIDRVVVKDITPSGNIDYEFCVVVDIPSDKGKVECFIYAKNVYEKEDIKTIAELKKGETVIDVLGEFGRFFSLLDDYYTRIELINASIAIRGVK